MCALPRCGDGVVHDGEMCDDGNALDDDACRNDCSVPGVAPEVSYACACVSGGDGRGGGGHLALLLGAGLLARSRR